MKAWEQQDGEPDRAYRAARIYLDLGANRTLSLVEENLRNRTGTGPEPDRNRTVPAGSTIKAWSSKWRWVERARAYDENLDRKGDQAREAARVDAATQLEQRRLKISETEWLLGNNVLQRVAEMLRFPLSETTTSTTQSADGKTITTTTTIAPASWRLRDIATLARVGIDLQRMAVGLPTRMAVQPFSVPGSDQAPVDQTQADADNGRIPPELAEAFRREAARIALENAGLADAGPDG